MSVAPLHRLYSHYSELPPSMRFLYTGTLCILGLGYLFALIYLYHTYAGLDGKPGLDEQDLVVAYAGSGQGSILETALHGPMSTMLPPEEANALIRWARNGADRATYETFIRPVVQKRCMMCHDGSNPHIPNFSTYDDLKKVTAQNTGANIFTLVRLSHIHLFGMTFIFFLAGLVFSHAYVRPVWLKCLIMGVPFVCIAIDILSWSLTKVWHPFAWATMGGGAAQGLSFAAMWFISMYQMWIGKPPKAVAQRREGEASVIG
jgi:cytochrome c5